MARTDRPGAKPPRGVDAGPDRQAAAERRRRRAQLERERQSAGENRTSPPGAVAPRRGIFARVQTYGLRQLQMLVGALGRLARTPASSLLTLAIIAIALALPLALQLLADNAEQATSSWQYRAELSAYLTPGQPPSALDALANRYGRDDRVAEVTAINADEGLARFRAESAMGDLLDLVADEQGQPVNPFPHTLVLVLVEGRAGAADVSSLADELRAEAAVDVVTEDLAWLRRLRATLDLLGQITLGATILLAGAALLVIANATRSDVSARREEIVISRLIGASDSFVRQPFVFTGMWYGLGGGLLALAIVGGLVLALTGPVARLARLYGAEFALITPSIPVMAAVVGAAALLGGVSAWVAATQSMRSMEPN